ncbi:BrnT family toxin [Methylomonas sp. MED-D]|uniref:BrnT family toxin n=1 Tax=unclassified Methylomonas TaxID=2608980 RepID=UPI0028A3BA7A|nr:BrnT family toxin [Methylomonas sp. MV1]MDT4330696.1 BrnT family toxin [Methylomonas sp. MV1]
MRLTFDPAKNARNIQERGLPFTMVENFAWQHALIMEDTRQDYGERRFRAFGRIEDRLFAVVFTTRDDALHIISFRKANKREEKRYGQSN